MCEYADIAQPVFRANLCNLGRSPDRTSTSKGLRSLRVLPLEEGGNSMPQPPPVA